MAWRPLFQTTLALAPLLLLLPACNGDGRRPGAGAEPLQAPAVQPRQTRAVLPAGTQFTVRVNQELRTDRSRPGDPFTASLMGELVDARGTELVPSGATVRGRVTAVSPPGPGGEWASLTIGFEALSFGGASFPLHGLVDQVVGREGLAAPRTAAGGPAAGTVIPVETVEGSGRLPRGARLSIRLLESVQLSGMIP
jgi:hypothetical protein